MPPGLVVINPGAGGKWVEPCGNAEFFLRVLGFFRACRSLRPIKLPVPIYNVINYEVVDEANIGEGDFQSIAYDKYRIVINGSVPVKLIADVKSLHMILEITDKILKHISGCRKNFLTAC